MFELCFLLTAVVVLNFYTHNQIKKDEAYLLDEEKPKYILLVWLIPIVGVAISQYRLHANRMFYVGVIAIYFILMAGLYCLKFKIIWQR